MLTVTPRFLAAVRDSHDVSIAATVYRPSDPTTPVTVDVIGGQVMIDRDARIRRQGSVDVAFSLINETARDLVLELPFGGTATIERGIRYADGTVERVQLGRFRIDSAVWNELQGVASLTLADRMAQVADEIFTAPYAPTGVKPSDACVAIVQDVFGSTIAYHVLTDPASETPLGDTTLYADDRVNALTDLASSIGAQCVFDNLGDFVIRPTGGAGTVAWTIDAGAHGSMIAAQETLDRSSVRNGVIVRAQPGTDQVPIYAIATYDDPTAPTRWGGPFGRVPLISDSTAVLTQDQADASARSLLNLRLGLQRTLTLEALPNPALEPDDIIQIVYADGRSEQQTVNSTRIGLDATGTLQLTTTSHTLTPAALQPTAGALYTDAPEWVAA